MRTKALDNPGTDPGGIAYPLSKRLLSQYVHELGAQFAHRRIRANLIHPTNCNTPMLHSEPMYQSFRPDLANATREEAEVAFPVQQAMPVPYVEPEDISEMVVFLVGRSVGVATDTGSPFAPACGPRRRDQQAAFLQSVRLHCAGGSGESEDASRISAGSSIRSQVGHPGVIPAGHSDNLERDVMTSARPRASGVGGARICGHPGRDLRTRREPEFVEDVFDVALCGASRDHQLGGDLCVA